MCGIAGYKCFGRQRPYRDEIERLLLGIEIRGTDATGIARTIGKNNIEVIKSPNKASVFVKTELPEKAELSKCMIMHTRAATQGLAKDNNNNHPIYSKEGVVLVHNGIINNDDVLFAKHSFVRDGLVDSEIILHLVKKGWWKDIKKLEELRGSCACALLNSGKPGELILVRSGNPLSVLVDKERDMIFFASTRSALESAVKRPFHRGFSTLMIEEVEDDLALLITNKGLEDIEEVTVSSSYVYKSNYPSYCSSSKFTTNIGGKSSDKVYEDLDDYWDRRRKEEEATEKRVASLCRKWSGSC